MIEDKDSNPLLGVGDIIEPCLELLHDRGEGMLLHQEEQTFFRFEIMIEPGQRYAGGAREVAHGRAFVSLDAKDFSCVVEDVAEAAIETGDSNAACGLARSAGSSGCR